MKKDLEPIFEKPLTKDVEHLVKLSRLFDSAVHIPGTPIKIGLDSVFGLIPGLGDVAGAALSGYIVLKSAKLGVPTRTLAHMLWNILVDVVGGVIPVLGDFFDIAWKANTKNVALLENALQSQSLSPRTNEQTQKQITYIVIGFLIGIISLAVFLTITIFRLIAKNI